MKRAIFLFRFQVQALVAYIWGRQGRGGGAGIVGFASFSYCNLISFRNELYCVIYYAD